MNKFMGIFGSKKAKFRLGIALLMCFGQFNMGYLYLIYVIITESFKYRKNRRILRNQKKQNRQKLNRTPWWLKLALFIIVINMVGPIISGAVSILIGMIVLEFIFSIPFKLLSFIADILGMNAGKNEEFVEYEEISMDEYRHRQNTSCDFENQTQYKKDDESGPTVEVKKTYKLSVCDSCGAKNKIEVGDVIPCMYCGGLID